MQPEQTVMIFRVLHVIEARMYWHEYEVLDEKVTFIW